MKAHAIPRVSSVTPQNWGSISAHEFECTGKQYVLTTRRSLSGRQLTQQNNTNLSSDIWQQPNHQRTQPILHLVKGLHHRRNKSCYLGDGGFTKSCYFDGTGFISSCYFGDSGFTKSRYRHFDDTGFILSCYFGDSGFTKIRYFDDT